MFNQKRPGTDGDARPMPHEERTRPLRRIDIANFGLTAWLGIIGAVFTGTQVWLTFKKDAFEREQKKFDIIVGLLQKCSSNDLSDREFASRFIGASKGLSIAAFNEYFIDDQKFNQAMTSCSNIVQNTEANTKSEKTIVAPPIENLPPSAKYGSSSEKSTTGGPTTPSAPPNDGPRFWIYLGTYRGGVWETKYINFPDEFDPTKFNSETDASKGVYAVRNEALNVRYGVFGATGAFPPPLTHPLQPGQRVTLRSAAQWFDSGDWWATIAPP